MNMRDAVAELERRRAKIRLMGGEEREYLRAHSVR